MDESFADPGVTAEPVATDNPVEAPSAPVEQGTGVDSTPEAEAPDEGGSLRHADYTRKTQELAEARKAFEVSQQQFAEQQQFLNSIYQDPDLHQQIQDYFNAPDNPDEFVDPFEQKQSELDQRLAAIEQREQAQQYQQVTEQALTQDLEEVTKLNGGTELSQEELDLLGHFVRPDAQGIPRIDVAAWDKQNKLYESRRQQWIAGKTAAPSPPPGGQPGSEAPDLNDPEVRQAWMAARMTAADG